MTLIFSHIDPTAGLFAASDILVSRPAKSDSPAILIPFREQPLQHVSGGYALVGTMQKSVIFGRTMVSFADSVAVAKAVIDRIRAVSRDGQDQIDLFKVLSDSGLSEAELKQVALIYYYNSPDPVLDRTAWNCEQLEVPGADAIVGAGSGLWNFFENLDYKADDGMPSHEAVLATFLAKMSVHPTYKSNSTESLDHLYGGWFEVAYRDKETFTKVPYAVRFWAKQGDILFSGGPIYIGWYRDNTLNVTRIQLVERAGVRSDTQSNFVVPDFLNRDHGGPPVGTIRPYFIMHIVHDVDNEGLTYTIVDSNRDSEEMIIELSEKGYRVTWSLGLVKRLLALGLPTENSNLSQRYT